MTEQHWVGLPLLLLVDQRPGFFCHFWPFSIPTRFRLFSLLRPWTSTLAGWVCRPCLFLGTRMHSRLGSDAPGRATIWVRQR